MGRIFHQWHDYHAMSVTPMTTTHSKSSTPILWPLELLRGIPPRLFGKTHSSRWLGMRNSFLLAQNAWPFLSTEKLTFVWKHPRRIPNKTLSPRCFTREWTRQDSAHSSSRQADFPQLQLRHLFSLCQGKFVPGHVMSEIVESGDDLVLSPVMTRAGLSRTHGWSFAIRFTTLHKRGSLLLHHDEQPFT